MCFRGTLDSSEKRIIRVLAHLEATAIHMARLLCYQVRRAAETRRQPMKELFELYVI